MPHWRNVGRPKKKKHKEDGVFKVGDRVCLPDGNGCCFHAGSRGDVPSVIDDLYVSVIEDEIYVSVIEDESGDTEDCRISCLEHEE